MTLSLNWFQVAIALLEIGAAAMYLSQNKPLLAGVMVCYALASAILAVL